MNARIRIMLTFDLSSAPIEKRNSVVVNDHVASCGLTGYTLPVMANHFEKRVIIGTTFKFKTHTPPSRGRVRVSRNIHHSQGFIPGDKRKTCHRKAPSHGCTDRVTVACISRASHIVCEFLNLKFDVKKNT